MSISPISTNSLTTAKYVNPYAKAEQDATVPQIKQDAQKAPQAAKTDTVTISQQALQMANRKDGASDESKESALKNQQESER